MNDLYTLFDQAQNLRHSGVTDTEAIVAYTDIREKAKNAGDLLLAADCLHMIGIVLYHEAGILKDDGKVEESHVKFKEVFATYEKALQEFQAMHTEESEMRVGAVFRDLGITATKMGEWDQAEGYISESIGVLQNLHQEDHLGMTQARLALILAEKNDFYEAEKLAREAVTRVDATDNWYFQSNTRRDLARILLKAGRKEEALTMISAAEKLLDEHPERNTDIDHATLTKLREEAKKI